MKLRTPKWVFAGVATLALIGPTHAALAATPPSVTVHTLTSLLTVAPEANSASYDRSLFVHWIDADGNGCDTREEVLIAESLVKATVGAGCKVTAGKWLSLYDDKTFTDPSLLDIDHFVPLKEAWESGASAWTPAQRQAYANDLGYADSLRAVSAGSNRSKSDGDPADWQPPAIGFRCTYLENWVLVKYRWTLAADAREKQTIEGLLINCPEVPLVLPDVVAGIPAIGAGSATPLPTTSATPNTRGTPIAAPTPSKSATANGTASGASSKLPLIHPGAFCKTALKGKKGISSAGVTYTCKSAAYDARLRWRK